MTRIPLRPASRGRFRGLVLTGTVMASLAWVATAEAHISIHPNTVPAGAFATLYVTVPGEQANAHVTRLDMLLPSGFTSVDYANVPGWKVSEVQTKLSKPIQTDDGPINQEVSQIIWTWLGPLNKVENGQFIQFPLSVAIPSNAAGKALKFKAVQSYSNGQIVHWIEPGVDDQNPAPTINITGKGGVIEDVAGDEAGPEPGQASGTSTTATSANAGGASEGLAIAALIVGVLGLVAGLSAIVLTRSTRRARDR
jgi:periplasmic copper chaperone A